MLSPATSRAKRSDWVPKLEFIEMACGFSIASIGCPAATFPISGIVFVG